MNNSPNLIFCILQKSSWPQAKCRKINKEIDADKIFMAKLFSITRVLNVYLNVFHYNISFPYRFTRKPTIHTKKEFILREATS